MRPSRFVIAASFAHLTLAACTSRDLTFTTTRRYVIAGVAKPVAGTLGASGITASNCRSATAALYRLDAEGHRPAAPLATSAVAADGSYSFSNVRALGVDNAALSQDLIEGGYVVDVHSCTTVYSRILTGFNGQNVSVGSSLLAYALQTPGAANLITADRLALVSLNNAVEDAPDYAAAYAALTANAEVVEQYRAVTQTAPAALLTAAPTPVSIALPATAREGESIALATTATHWQSNYDYAYLWEIDGVPFASTATTTLAIPGNAQGTRTLSVFYGQKNTLGALDQTKPYLARSFALGVSNDRPAVPPVLGSVGAGTVNSPLVPLQIATGAARANCDTFSNLALTEDSPVAPTSRAAYTIACTQSPTQNLTHTLVGGLGSHVLRLWARDAAGNISATSSSTTVTYSLVVPVIVISTPNTSAPSGPGVTIAGTCDLDAGDVRLSGPIAGSPVVIPCAAGTFSHLVTLTGADGAKVVTAAQTNSFGTTGTATANLSLDTTPPGVEIASLTISPTNTAALTVSVVFTEAVAGFDASKIVVTNGTLASFSGGPATYAFTLTPQTPGPVNVNVAAGAASDLAGNASLAAATFTRVYDNTPSAVTLTSTAPTLTRLAPIPASVTFAKPVTGFSSAGIGATNATVGNLLGAGTSYTFDLIPSGQGSVSAVINAGAAVDAAGNASLASSALARTYDSIAPTVVVATSAANPTNLTALPVTLTFSESVAGLTAASLTATNATISNLAGSGSAYTLDLMPSAQGPVTLRVNAGSAADAAGNPSLASSVLSRTFDSILATATLASAVATPTNLGSIPVTLTFSKTVTGLTAAGLTATNATVSGFTGGGTTYAFNLTPTAEGVVTVALDAAAGTDSAGNGSANSNQLSWIYDVTAPVLTFTQPANGAYVNLTNQADLTVAGTCTAPGTISLAAGGVSGTAPCTAGAFEAHLDLRSLASGGVTLTANGTDAAGNAATPATLNLTKDVATPSATLAGAPAALSNVTTLNATVGGGGVTSYRYKTGPTGVTDCAAFGGYSDDIAVATPITEAFGATPDGAQRLCVLGRNAAGNAQAVATVHAWTKDTAVTPITGLTITPASPGKEPRPVISGATEGAAVVQMYSSLACLGSVLGNVTADGAGAFAVAAGTALGADGNFTFSIQATDLAGNVRCASTSIAYTLDTLAPTVSLATTAPTFTNVSPLPFTATFSEPVTGFTGAALSLTNATITGLTGSGTSYAFGVVPTGQGPVSVGLAANKTLDAAGNGNPVVTTVTRTYDTLAPALTIATPVTSVSTNLATPTFTGACETGLPITLDGSGLLSPGGATCTAGAYSVAVTLTGGEGLKNVSLTQTDAATNATTVTRAITYDTTAPALTFASVANQTQITNGNAVTFGGGCESGFNVIVAGGVDAGSVACTGGTWSYATTTRTSDAARAFTFTQTDAAGNVTTINGGWTRDTSAPLVAITAPAANLAAQTTLTVSGTCESGLNVALAGAGLLSSVTTACASGTFSQLVYLSAGEGTKLVTATQTDLANNATTVSRAFVRDTIAPALTQTLQASPYYTNTNSATFGGACETGVSIAVTGADVTSVACTSNAWTYAAAAQTTDASRTYTFTQTDAAGNQAQISANWRRLTVPPAFTMASSNAYLTSGDAVTFNGACVTGLSIAVGGSGAATLTCAGGTWSYAPSRTTDGNYAFTFTETDQAGNVSTLNGTWTRSTSGPIITIAQGSPQISRDNALIISGTCSGGTAGSNGVISITGAVTTTTTCSSATSTPGTWSYTAAATTDGTNAYAFATTDNFTSPRTSSASLTWQRDATAPVITNASFTLNGGTNTATAVPYSPASFAVTDNLTTVVKFCLKTSATPPAATDACWLAVNGGATNVTPANSISISNFPFNVGIIPQTYQVYLWAMDGAGNISTNAAVVGTDLTNITLAPVAPPSVSTVLVGNADVMNGAPAERLIPAGTEVFVRWTAAGPSLNATPVSIFFTSDDVTWTQIATNLTNGVNNCASLQGAGSAATAATGCYRITSALGGSPNNGYYRVRVSVSNSTGATTYSNSLPVNANTLQILAGNTETGLNGAATSALFQSAYVNSGWADAQSLVVNSNGVVYFRDLSLGLVAVDPQDGKLKQLIPLGAGTSGVGDGGSIANARLRMPVSLAIDGKDRVYILDYDRIRLVDFSTTPATIRTLIGGGAQTGNTVVGGTNFGFSANYSAYASVNAKQTLLVLPNGNIFFVSDSSSMYQQKRIRRYDAATNTISSIFLSGASYTVGGSGYHVTDFSQCGVNNPLAEFDPVTSAITNFYVNLAANSGVSANCTTPAIAAGAQLETVMKFDLASGAVDTSQIPPMYLVGGSAAAYAATVPALDGKAYLLDKNAAWLTRYNSGTNTFDKILGTGVRTSCVDGTLATACGFDPGGAFVDAQGRIYFADRGRIRTIIGGKVVTLYGQSYSFGDGGLASDARFGALSAVTQRSDGKIIASDTTVNRLRLLSAGGTISTIAGNDSYANVSTAINATAQGLPSFVNNSNLTLDVNDNLYFVATLWAPLYLPATYATTPATTKWSVAVDTNGKNWFQGTTSYFSPAADGQYAGSLLPPGNVIQYYGFNGTSFLFYGNRILNGVGTDPTYFEVDLNTGLYTVDLTASTVNSTYCPDGTLQSSCTGFSNSNNYIPGAYDSVTSQWQVMNLDNRTIKSFGRGRTGTVQTPTVFASAGRAWIFKRFGSYNSHRYYYYCNQSTGRIWLRDADTAVEKALNWPITSVACSGYQMAYDPTNDAVVFPFTQNGLSGVAQVLNAHPSANGL